MTREEFDVYLKKFNGRDYDGFLEYFADDFEMIHVGGSFKTRESVKKFYAFLHNYIKESVIVDRFVSDEYNVVLEARVQIEGVKELTPEAVAASDWPKLTPLKVGQKALIPQFIHYHLEKGKFKKVVCAEL
ncbi:MAG: nuclear transport factor 2 family protein [Deltaproteobacteria bacterium]|nr:nuclear transport factor 2 family protein [Deltaproteobacteria bacterium]